MPLQFMHTIRDIMRYHNAIFEIRCYEDGYLVSFNSMAKGVSVSVQRQISFEMAIEMKPSDFHYLTAIMGEELEHKVRRL